jgi:hypothetical protein
MTWVGYDILNSTKPISPQKITSQQQALRANVLDVDLLRLTGMAFDRSFGCVPQSHSFAPRQLSYQYQLLPHRREDGIYCVPGKQPVLVVCNQISSQPSGEDCLRRILILMPIYEHAQIREPNLLPKEEV